MVILTLQFLFSLKHLFMCAENHTVRMIGFIDFLHQNSDSTGKEKTFISFIIQCQFLCYKLQITCYIFRFTAV